MGGSDGTLVGIEEGGPNVGKFVGGNGEIEGNSVGLGVGFGFRLGRRVTAPRIGN